VSAKRKSQKLSGSNSGAPPEAAPLLFIDRCAWSRRLDEALRHADVPFIAHHERFADNLPDEDWLEIAGTEGWIVITRDKNIRRKPNEIQAYRDNNVIAFVLASGLAGGINSVR
jgi:hypothetical protein